MGNEKQRNKVSRIFLCGTTGSVTDLKIRKGQREREEEDEEDEERERERASGLEERG